MKNILKNSDLWGSTLSIACAIHCAMLPIFFSAGVIGSHNWFASPLFEVVMISMTLYFVYKSIIKGYFEGIVSFKVFFTCCLGLLLVVFHHFLGEYSTYTVVLGGIMIASAHLVNFFFHRHLEH